MDVALSTVVEVLMSFLNTELPANEAVALVAKFNIKVLPELKTGFWSV